MKYGEHAKKVNNAARMATLGGWYPPEGDTQGITRNKDPDVSKLFYIHLRN